jgi:hypothetical protein
VIVGDDAGEGRQFSKPRSGERVLPFHIDIAWPVDLPNNVDGAVAIDAIADVSAVLGSCVAEGGAASHGPILPLGPHTMQAPEPNTLGEPQDGTLCELLLDCEEDKVLRAVLVGTLREADRSAEAHTRHEDEGVCLARASGRAHSLL